MRCKVCELTCEIGDGKHGRCGMYRLEGQAIVPRYDAQVSTFNVSHIEDIPIFHFHPGSLTLTLGTVGCNFDCSYCINSYSARTPAERTFLYQLSPSDVVRKATEAGCRNIAFSVNEPAVSFPFFLELAKLAKDNGLRVGCATNGYFTVEAADELAGTIDFANVSLKAMCNGFYQRVCKVPSVDPVVRNIRQWRSQGVHIEVTTPITLDTNENEVTAMAEFIGGLGRDIPWHLFRLLPEYKMADQERTDLAYLIRVRQKALQHLDHIFIGNAVGSEWLDTICPHCGTKVIRRINTSGCGSKLFEYRLDQGKCPECRSSVAVTGECEASFSEWKQIRNCAIPPTETDEPSLGLLDTGGFQKTFDFRNGEPVSYHSPLIDQVATLTAHRPYPGDSKPESDSWVTDMALSLVNVYEPHLAVLTYSQAVFRAIDQPGDPTPAFEHVFGEVARFLDKTGYEPVIWGCGGMEPIKTIFNLENLLGTKEVFALSGGKLAYLDADTLEMTDAATLGQLRKVAELHAKNEYLDSLEEDYSREFADSLGDFVAIAKPGVIFKGLGSGGRTQYRSPALESMVPVHTNLGSVESITEIAPLVTKAVRDNKKVALIVLEGVGFESFPYEAQSCRNSSGALIYDAPWQQYITLGSGVPYHQHTLPMNNRHWLQDYRPYPYSGRFHRLLDGTVGQQIGDKRSLAVGNRSIFTHAVFGADVAVECYCCYMRNYGTMAVFRDQALK